MALESYVIVNKTVETVFTNNDNAYNNDKNKGNFIDTNQHWIIYTTSDNTDNNPDNYTE